MLNVFSFSSYIFVEAHGGATVLMPIIIISTNSRTEPFAEI